MAKNPFLVDMKRSYEASNFELDILTIRRRLRDNGWRVADRTPEKWSDNYDERDWECELETLFWVGDKQHMMATTHVLKNADKDVFVIWAKQKFTDILS